MALTGLALWLSNEFPTYATPLGWTDESFNHIVSKTLELLGIDAEEDETDTILHLAGSYCLLRRAKNDVTFMPNKFGADGGNYDLNLEEKIKNAVADAYAELAPYLDEDQTISIDWGSNTNPYAYDSDRDNLGNF